MALYPSGLRGESAKLLFASSNLAKASMRKKNIIIISIFLILGLLYAGMSYSNVRFTVDNLNTYGIIHTKFSEDNTITKVLSKQNTDTVVSVKGKKAIFIGDSHTSNYDWGWQVILCKKTGLIPNNTAIIGKHLPWMVNVANMGVTNNFDFCFIYGGANDIHGNRNPYSTVKDVQRIVDICNSRGVKPFVLTGFNAEECVRPIHGQEFYPKAYSEYQKILIDSIKNSTIIDIRVIVKNDCGDWMCHMNPSGHKKIAEAIIQKLKLKVI